VVLQYATQKTLTENALPTVQHHDPAHIIYDEKDDAGNSRVQRSEPIPSDKRRRPRRSVAEAKLAFEQRYGDLLVIDDLSYHTAHSLCESDTSAGPSFVNPVEGYYCNMKTKTLHPICSEDRRPRGQNRTVCFDMEKNDLGEYA
jgi:hypothetical protein